MATVRGDIIAAIIANLGSVDGVGLVIDSGVDFTPAGRPNIAPNLEADSIVVEFSALSSEADQSRSVQAGTDVEAFTFDCILLAIIPAGLFTDDTDPLSLAAEIDAKLVGAYLDSNGFQRFPGLAIEAHTLGGGGLVVIDGSMPAVEHAFKVRYRHRRGNPAVPA